jgi:hypothetical protein
MGKTLFASIAVAGILTCAAAADESALRRHGGKAVHRVNHVDHLYRRRGCPDAWSCFSLYGAYGPYGGAAYWNRYTYQQGRLW